MRFEHIALLGTPATRRNSLIDDPDPLPDLLLASGSPYRRELMARLRVPFFWMSPEIDESVRDGESAEALVCRLARDKATALSREKSTRFIIGSDQVALLFGRILGKPGNFDAAFEQLSLARGREITFLTGICLLDEAHDSYRVEHVAARVTMRHFDDASISRYLQAEQPYDCSGSLKCEGLGITLIERFDCDDPTALMGLPLIRLVAMLRDRGYDVLRYAANETRSGARK